MVPKASVPPSATKLSKSPRNDGDGHSVSNKILLGLSHKDRDLALSKLELVRLKLHQVLYEAGETIKSCYFVNDGLVSILAVQPDGKSVEVGLIGSEGFTGLPLLVGYHSSPTRVITQGDGTAYRCSADVLRQLIRECPTLERQLHRFGQRLGMQITQIAACNRLHEVEERLARWILMSQDRLHSDNLPLTQEFLSHMLGTRRSSVTMAAGALQKAGLISYTRGSVSVVSREGLEDAACDCYGIVQQQLADWTAEAD
jgi:CRP-like cAMP-binding protein